MKKTHFKKILIIILLFTTSSFFIGCNSATAQPTSTPFFPTETKTALPPTASVSPSATATRTISTHTPYITPTPTPPTPTITAPAPRNPPLELPDGLGIEEYSIDPDEKWSIETQIGLRHGYPPHNYFFQVVKQENKKINNQPFSIEATREKIMDQIAEVHILTAFVGEEQVFSINCGSLFIPLLLSSYTFENHWYIQTYCNEKFTIFSDGVSLNKKLGYQASYAFQILDDKPFYLFTREDKVWLFYDDTEVLLGYDQVLLHYCCLTAPPPSHYENMIFFIARTDEQYYAVAIGKFTEQ